MERIDDHSIDDIISSLNSIRELNAKTHASAEGLGEDRKGQPAEDEIDSLALEEYLASRLQQIGENAPERKITGLKTGNGWEPSKIVEHVFKIEPISIKRAVEVALHSKRSLRERFVGHLKRGRDDKVVGTSTVEYLPIWKVKGFHECYYLRTNSYRVNVKDDVVGVEVEGKSRDLILEKKHRHFIPAAIIERIQKLGSFLSNESKYFIVSDALELATKRSESELTLVGLGKSLSSDEEMELTSWRLKRIFDLSELKVRSARIIVRDPGISKDMVLTRFRDRVVHMPDRFKQVLSNRLEITELKRIYVPFIRVSIQKGMVPHEVIVNGSSGDIATDKQLELLEHESLETS